MAEMARFVPGTTTYVLCLCGAGFLAFVALIAPRFWESFQTRQSVEAVMSTLDDAFRQGARDYASGVEPVPATSHHPVYLLGYMSSLLPGCTVESMKPTHTFSACYIPSGKLQTDGNYVLSLGGMKTRLADFDADGRPRNASGNRIDMPSSADNVQMIGFYFTAPAQQFAALAPRFLSLFSTIRLSDVPPNGMWDTHPTARFGVRSCFLHHIGGSVGADCYPQSQTT